MKGHQWIGWWLGAVASLVAIWTWIDAQHERRGTVEAALEVMLGEVEDDRAGDLYWLKQKEATEGLTAYELGRKGTIEAGLKRIERQQEALNDD